MNAQIDKPLPNYRFYAPAIIAAVHKENREIVDLLLKAGAHIVLEIIRAYEP